jgi:hypothetical protein
MGPKKGKFGHKNRVKKQTARAKKSTSFSTALLLQGETRPNASTPNRPAN